MSLGPFYKVILIFSFLKQEAYLGKSFDCEENKSRILTTFVVFIQLRFDIAIASKNTCTIIQIAGYLCALKQILVHHSGKIACTVIHIAGKKNMQNHTDCW